MCDMDTYQKLVLRSLISISSMLILLVNSVLEGLISGIVVDAAKKINDSIAGFLISTDEDV